MKVRIKYRQNLWGVFRACESKENCSRPESVFRKSFYKAVAKSSTFDDVKGHESTQKQIEMVTFKGKKAIFFPAKKD